jgi:endonuclease III
MKLDKNKVKKIYNILEEKLKIYKIPLAEQIQIKTKKPFFVLIGTILSSRTKDITTAKVCDNLFKVVKSFSDLEKIKNKDLEKILYGVGFYKQKTKLLKKIPKIIKTKFNNKIPNTINELILLPGVGRKSANLIISVAFNKPAICVDVHVHRILNRIGIINTKNSLETEIYLRKNLPEKYWNKTNYLFVILGQNICYPRKPNCNICYIQNYCKYYNETQKNAKDY